MAIERNRCGSPRSISGRGGRQAPRPYCASWRSSCDWIASAASTRPSLVRHQTRICKRSRVSAAKASAAVEPGQRLAVAVGVVGVPGAAGEQLHAELAPLRRAELGRRRRSRRLHAVAGRQQRQRTAVGRLLPLPPRRRLQRRLEALRGFGRAALVEQRPALRVVPSRRRRCRRVARAARRASAGSASAAPRYSPAPPAARAYCAPPASSPMRA